MLVERLERLDRAAAVAELAVVVVLDDRRAVAFRPGQQGHPPPQRHRHPERELVRGADGDQPGVGRDGLDHQPLCVDRHRGHLGSERPQQPSRRPVPGRLHGDPVAWLQQHPGHQVDRLLGAVGDHDVPGVGLHPAGQADVAGDRLAQGRVAGGVAVGAAAHRGRAQLLGQQPAPGLVGEQPGVGDARPEVELGRVVRHGRHGDRVPDRPRPQRSSGRPGTVAGAGDGRADEGPGTDPGGDEPLAAEPVVGDRHGGARDAEAPGQLPGRRQATARRQAAVQDGPAQLPVDLAGQVLAADQADMDLGGAAHAAQRTASSGRPAVVASGQPTPAASTATKADTAAAARNTANGNRATCPTASCRWNSALAAHALP